MTKSLTILAVIGIMALLSFAPSASAQSQNSTDSLIDQIIIQIRSILSRLDIIEEKLNFESTFRQVNDTPLGHTIGWNPGNGKEFYVISDNAVRSNSVISITVDRGEANCHTRQINGHNSFKIRCGDGLADGATLNYEIRTPIQ